MHPSEAPAPSGGTDLRGRVAAEVRAVMARKRINVPKLAALIGASPAYVYRRYNGETAFDVDDLHRVSEALDVPVMTFFPEKGEGHMTGYFPALLGEPDEADVAA